MLLKRNTREFDVDSTQVRSEATSKTRQARKVDMKLEIVVIPVSDVDRAKRFYGGLGWRLDADFAAEDDFRVIQFTPPGSGCSVIFGRNVTAAAPGSGQGLVQRSGRQRLAVAGDHRATGRTRRDGRDLHLGQ